MDEHKMIPDEKKEDYSFMQEVIKDERIDGRKMKQNIFRMMCYGTIFGLMACLVFCLSLPWMQMHIGVQKVRVEIPKDEELEEKIEEHKEQTVTEVKNIMDKDGYRQVIQSLAVTTEKQRKCMANIEIMKANQEKLIQEFSGFVLADNGHELIVIGNAVKMKDNQEVWITFYEGSRYKAAVKVCEFNLGIGVYCVEKEMIDDSVWKKVYRAQIGNSNIAETGEVVIILGKPFGQEDAFAYGVIAPDEEQIELSDGSYRVLSTNVPVEKEGSGIIFNEGGKVIGLIAPKAVPEGSKGRIGGYAISDVKDIIELLSNGSVIPYVGVFGMDVSEKLIEKNMPEGVYVKAVEADSPAMEAGIQSGDVLCSIDDEAIISWDQYHGALMKKTENSKIKIKGYRQGSEDTYVEMEYEVLIGSKNKK